MLYECAGVLLLRYEAAIEYETKTIKIVLDYVIATSSSYIHVIQSIPGTSLSP